MNQSPSGNDQPWTVLRLLEWTTGYFKQRGSDSPRLDAEVLLAHARDCSRVELYTAFEALPSDEQRVAFRELVRRRGEGMPVALLVGYREFYSLRFRVNEDTLIPRPETEHLVLETLDRAKLMAYQDRPLQIADIGTGSGAIAIALAKHLSDSRITAVDCSSEALRIAQWNAQQHDVTDVIEFSESHLLESIESPQQFDIICSNPPYVSDAEYDQLPPTVRDFEPKTALVSGPTGTEVIEQILDSAAQRLAPSGWVILEISPMIAERCRRLVEQRGFLAPPEISKDLAGLERVLAAQRT